MRNLLFSLSYDGSQYHGWQVQKNSLAVQELVQDAIEKATGVRDNIIGCSRTDTGVHAKEYFFNMRTESRLEAWRFPGALNAHLPSDIAVRSCSEVAYDFNARYDCLSKEYVYLIWNARERNPFLDKYALHYRYLLDEGKMQKEADCFVGRHDFAAFCSANSKVMKTERRVNKFEVEREGDKICLTVEADGFLYNMVRIMVGTLLRIEEGKIQRESIPYIIASKNRAEAGMTAPAQGLFLNRVFYPEKFQPKP
ncbi:MAG: tRNA pseudouridine(38-40) synthase TruA [Clostridiales bacterium]|nr:tRNA pseudouridine(38-40) synthase TruA [Clostridiales bacterium]